MSEPLQTTGHQKNLRYLKFHLRNFQKIFCDCFTIVTKQGRTGYLIDSHTPDNAQLAVPLMKL